MEWVLMLDDLGLGILDGHAIHRDGELSFGHFPVVGARLSLLELMVELQFLHTLLHHINTLGLVHFNVTKKLEA